MYIIIFNYYWIEIMELEKTLSFEDFKRENWITYWLASDMMLMLWYPDMKSFQKVIDRAAKALISLWIDQFENIIPIKNKDWERDYKLTRFACYLSAMNWDPKKIEVANAQKYFAEQSRKFELFVEWSEWLDRLLIRDEITEWNKALASEANKAGIENYANFQNAWYRGMYNMFNSQLAKKRWVEKNKLMETMWRTELAANLFRITQTEERIKNRWIKWQQQLEQTHYTVWRTVRNMIIENTWTSPENLKQEEKLPEVKKKLKKWYREMKKIDKPKKN